MEKVTIQNNEIANYVPLAPLKPQLAFFVKENSMQYPPADYNYDGTSSLSATTVPNNNADAIFATKNGSAVGSYNNPTDYVGATTIDVPHFIIEAFADFKLYDFQSNNPSSLAGDSVNPSNTNDLFDSLDTDLKVTTVANGLQFLRIPVNKFNEVDGDGIVTNKKFGKYYVQVSPKYIEATIVQVLNRDQVSLQTLENMGNAGQGFGKRRKTYEIDKSNFLGTAWNFEQASRQAGRFYGSITEVWDASGTYLKQTLVVNEDNLGLNSPSTTGFIGLHPELVGYDALTQVITPGDLIRVYPRETYFKPIFIELVYDATNSVTDLVRFMMNDVVQDTTRAIYEVYDENGVTTDGQGNISGNVVLSYQISQEGKYQIRRHSPIPTGTGGTIQTGL